MEDNITRIADVHSVVNSIFDEMNFFITLGGMMYGSLQIRSGGEHGYFI